MILEIRHYTLKPGLRENFIKFFERHNYPAQCGHACLWPLRDLEHADKVHWLRAFPSIEERERLKDAFYDGRVWNTQIEPVAMRMIAHYTAELTETTHGFESFNGDGTLKG